MIAKGRVVGQYAYWIFIDMQTVFKGFYCNAPVSIRNDPVQGRQGEIIAEIFVQQICVLQQVFRLFYGFTLSQQPWDQFKRCNIHKVFAVRLINCKTREVQSCHAQTLFICGIIIQRVSVYGYGHTNHGKVMSHSFPVAKAKRIVSGSKGDGFS